MKTSQLILAFATGSLVLSACALPPAPPRAAQPMATAVAVATSASAAVSVLEPTPLADIPAVNAVLETQPVLDMDADKAPNKEARLGDADDPAIWVHPTDTAQSIIVGVLKNGGLDVFDLDGMVLQTINPEGSRYNNVDLRYGFMLGGEPVDLVVATDRYKDTLAFFKVNPATRQLEDVSAPTNKLLFTPEGKASDEETTAYGIALYQAGTTLYAFVNRRDTGDVAQLELLDNSGKVGWKTVRTFSVPVPDGGELSAAQCEGMVADDTLGILYVGQEDVGIWKYSAKPDGGSEGKLIHAAAPKGPHLEADVEGLTIYHAADGKGYLLASSQGNNTFAVFTREGENAYLGSFQITRTSDGTIDGAQESDGAMVLNVPLGPRFPNGLLVVQDGFNEPAVMVEDEGETENVSTNFKFIGWDVVAKAFAKPLVIDTTSYDPRKP